MLSNLQEEFCVLFGYKTQFWRKPNSDDRDPQRRPAC